MEMTDLIEMVDSFKDRSIIYLVRCEGLYYRTRHVIGGECMVSTDHQTT